MPKVTVIMPALNVEKYLRPCIESVCSQSLQDIEILFIDAGSTDATLDIIDQYARNDNRIKIMHSEKKSYGYQLNWGMSIAKGQYIGVVETDDIVDSEMFEVLYKTALKCDADYVKGTAQAFRDISSNIRVTNPIKCVDKAMCVDAVINPQEHPELFVTDRFLWLGIYKKDVIKSIKLNETKGAAFQDIGFAFQMLHKASKAIYLDKDMYFYRQDNGNASSYDTKGFKYLVDEYKYVGKYLVGKNMESYKAYYRKMLNQCLGRYAVMAASGFFWEDSWNEMEILQGWLQEAVNNSLLMQDSVDTNQWEKLQLLLQGCDTIYRVCSQEYNRKKENISMLCQKSKKQQIVIFSCGKYGKFFHAIMEKLQPGRVVAYCDNCEDNWNKSVQNISVLAPKEAIKHYSKAFFVIANANNIDEIKTQLMFLGISEEQMGIYKAGIDMQLFRLT